MATPNLEEGSECKENFESAVTDYKRKLGTTISCMATSLHQPGTLAVGSNTILMRKHPHNFFTKLYINRSSEPTLNVTSLSWHPEKPLLAFGTDTGIVGIFSNIDSVNAKDVNQKILFKHKGTVYSVVWGPCSKYQPETKGDTEDSPKFFVYSCGGGSIRISKNTQSILSHANLNTILGSKEHPFYTEICWKPDFSQFAVGTKNSYLYIYDGQTFNLIFQICNDDADVWCVRWHPYTLMDLSRSKLHDWIAVGFNKKVIHVYDLEIEALSDATVPVVYESIRELSGHIHTINKLEWSPHTEGRLASCSKDCTVQIWNVISGEPLVNFCLHDNFVLCIMWDNIDPDMVFSGDSYGNLHCWRPSNQVQSAADLGKVRIWKRSYYPANKHYYNRKQDKPVTCQQVAVPNGKDEMNNKADMEAQISRQKKGHRRHRKNFNGAVTQTSLAFAQAENGGEPENSSKEQKELSDCLIQPTGKESEGMEITKYTPDHRRIIDFAMEKVLTWKRNNPENFKKLLKLPRSEIPEDTFLSAFIGRMEDFYKFIDASNCNLFRPNVGNDTDRAFAYRIILLNSTMTMYKVRDDFTPFSIGIARTVSKRHWFDTCMYFARNNSAKKVQRLKMLTTLLSLNHFATAFRNMKIDGYFMEAYVIANCFLPEGDPLIKECEQNMLNYFQWRRRFELTFFYYLCHGDTLTAASVLNRRGSPVASRGAAYLCQKHGFIEEAKQYSLWGILKGFWSDNWDCMKEIVAEQPEVKDLRWVIAVYESLTKILAAKKLTETHGICEANLFGHEESSEKFLWKSYNLEGTDYLSRLLKSLKDEDLLDFESPDFFQLFSSFKAFVHKNVRDNSLAYMDMKVHLALHICDFFIALHLKNAEEKFTSAFQSIGRAMVHCFDSENFTSLNMIFLLCFPFDVLWKDEVIKIQLNVSCISENIIREAYKWLEVNISSRGLVNKTGNVEFLQKKFNKVSLREELLNVSPVDIIVTLFATNIAKMLFRSVQNNSPTKLTFDCHHTHKDSSFISPENNASDLSSEKENIEVLLQSLEPEKNQLQVVEIDSVGVQEGVLRQAGKAESVSPEVEEPESVSPEVEEPESVSPEVEEPESVSPEVEEPESASLQAEEPKGVSSQAEEPEGVSSQAEESEGVLPQAEESEGVLPQAEESEGVLPQAEESEGVLPQAEESEGVLPQAEESEGVLPQAEEPEGVLPQAEEPEGVLPQAEEPEGVLPQAEEPEGVLPQAEEPEGVLPQAEEPEGVLPQTEKPELVLPQTEEPQLALPQTEEPELAWSQTKEPELTLPQTKEPELVSPPAELEVTLPPVEGPELVLLQTEEPEIVLSQAEESVVVSFQTEKLEAFSSQAEEPEVALPQAEEPEYIFPQAKELKSVLTQAEGPEVLTRAEGVSPRAKESEDVSPQTIVPNIKKLKSDSIRKLEYVPSQTKDVPPQILLLGKMPSKTEVADEVQEHGSGSVTTVPKKDKEICDYCEVEKVSNRLHHGCCLNRFRPLVSLMNVVTANTCKDIFKINGYWKTKDFPGDFNFWDFRSPTESNSDSDEFIGSVDDFIRSEDKLLELLKLLEVKGQVNRIPNVESCACILENLVMEIINFCVCPCLEIKLQSFVVSVSRFLNNG